MALTYGELSAVTQKLFIPKLVDDIFGSNPLLARLRKNNVRLAGGGASIMVPVMFAQTTAAGWYSGADTLSTTANDQITSAEFSFCSAYSNITITRSDELDNSGDEGVINLVKSKVQMAEKTLADVLASGLYTDFGWSTNAFEGLRMACSGYGTYGGIARSTNSWWGGQTDATTTDITASGFNVVQSLCTIDNDKPTVALTTRAVYDDLYNEALPYQRLVDVGAAQLGFTNVMVNGVPVIVDSHCPTSHLFLLNEKYLELVINKAENFRFEPFIKPTNQNVNVAKVYFRGAFTCSNPRLQGMFNALV